MLKLLVVSAVATAVAGRTCQRADESSIVVRGAAPVSVQSVEKATPFIAVQAELEQAHFCLPDGCYNFASEEAFSVLDEFTALAKCDAGLQSCKVCVSRVAPVNAEKANAAGFHDAAKTEQALAARRMSSMFKDVRRLQFSYNFDCVNSLDECMEDDNCNNDEECFFPQERKKQRLLNAVDSSNKKGQEKPSPAAARKLLFGGNAVGQCVCK
jgi:hypothetical protein